MLLKNGKLVRETGTEVKDIRIKSGKIAEIEEGLTPHDEEEVIDVEGRLVFPGFIDGHVHFQLESRGTVSIDDFFHGSISAAHGGVTTYIDYADQDADSLLAGLRKRQAKAEPKTALDYNLHLSINNDFEPDIHIEELKQLPEEGIRSIKIFTTYKGMYMLSPEKMETLFEKAAEAGIVVTVHAEYDEIIQENQEKYIKEGKTGLEYHPDIRPAESEAKAVEQIAELSRKTGATAYIVHLSSRKGYEAVKKAQEEGIDIIAETTPHYLLLTRDKLTEERGELNLMTPPLREKEDNQALWEGLAEDVISVVGTDHCSFTPQQKSLGDSSLNIYPGIPGVETLFPLLYTYGVKEGRIGLERLVEVLAGNPARVFGLYPRKGSLKEGSDADLVVFDPEPEWILNGENLHSLAGYTPYAGMKVKGQIEQTFLRGEPVINDGRFQGRRGAGRFISCTEGGKIEK